MLLFTASGKESNGCEEDRNETKMKILIWLLISVLSAILYRVGGSRKGLTKWRDCGCSTITVLLLWFFLGWHWQLILVFGLMFAALTTYYDTVFGYDNMFAHGAGIGLSTIPLLWCGVQWYSIVIYTIALSVSMGFSRHVIKIDNKTQELIKGALIVVLLRILLTNLKRRKK